MKRKNGTSTVLFGAALTVTALSLYAALASILEPTIYGDLLAAGTIDEQSRRGALSQDIVTAALAFVYALVLFGYLRNRRPGDLIALVGGLGYFFYAYGLYSIEAYYTVLYPLYLLIFGISLWGVVLGFLELRPILTAGVVMTRRRRVSIAAFLLLIPLLLVPVWMVLMMQMISEHSAQTAYGVFLLDLTVVFPALLLAGGGLLREKPWAGVLAGVMLIKVFTVCVSWAYGEVRALAATESEAFGLVAISAGLTLVSSFLLAGYFRQLHTVSE